MCLRRSVINVFFHFVFSISLFSFTFIFPPESAQVVLLLNFYLRREAALQTSSSTCPHRPSPIQWSLSTERKLHKNFPSNYYQYKVLSSHTKSHSVIIVDWKKFFKFIANGFSSLLNFKHYLPEFVIKLVALTSWDAVAKHLVTLSFLLGFPG